MISYLSPEGVYPQYLADVLNVNSEYEVGDTLPEGWREVMPSIPPARIEGKIREVAQPEEVGGVLYQRWSFRDLTEEEIAEREARAAARQKLIEAGLTEEELRLLGIS